ncbi:hypothetical protein [Pseudomonas phage vB_PsaM_M1]|nr:hypothetical protein [Pseudomonas phage vB_PsaM_M1]
MTELHKVMTKEDIKKIQWCAKLALNLSEDHGWEFHQAYEYAEVLHFDYVELAEDWDADPIEVLQEDMTYWGD